MAKVGICVVVAAVLASACGSSEGDDGAGGAGGSAAGSGGSGGGAGASGSCSVAAAGQVGSDASFPAGVPVCARGEHSSLRIEGSVAGIPIDIEQTGADVFGGYSADEVGGGFQSPFVLDANAPFIGFSWTGAGQAAPAPISGGFLRLPPGAAGEGQWSFREGLLLRAEDGARGDLLFSITSVVKTIPGVCQSSPVWAELRGCWAGRAF